MAEITKQALVVDNNQSFPNNNNGQITPTVLRAFNTNMIDSTVNQIVYTADSASFNSQIAAISGSTAINTGSLLLTASFDNGTRNLTFTKGNATQFSVNIPDVSGSTLPAGTVSGSSQITALGFVSSSVTGSSLVTGSVSGNTLTFTKGDASTFTLTVATGSTTNIDTGSFATTGSNLFRGNQTISGSTNKNGINFLTGSSAFFVGQDEVGRFIISSSNQSRWMELSNDNGFAEIYAQTTNFNNSVNLRGRTEARGIFQEVGYPVEINGTLSASLQTGYAFVGGADGYSKQVPTASFSSASLVTGSVNVNVLTFTKGDGSTFNLTVAASGSAPAGTVSSSQQILNYNIFATTGSNTFSGSQTINGGNKLFIQRSTTGADNILRLGPDDNENNFQFIVTGSSTDPGQPVWGINVQGGTWANAFDAGVTFSSYVTASQGLYVATGSSSGFNAPLANGFTFVGDANGRTTTVATSSFGGSTDTGSLLVTASFSGNTLTFTKGDATQFSPFGAFATTGSNTFTGAQTLNANSNVVSGSITFNGTSVFNNTASLFNSVKLNNSIFNQSNFLQIDVASGSIVLQTPTAANGISGLGHLSASSANGLVNLVFKNNNSTGDTIISGSNNIFTNPAAVTTGYKRYIGGSNNLYLNSTNGINSQITQSATSVSGATPTMNNNIFIGTGNFSINQAPNTGTHTYSQNIIGGTGTTTINALGFTGSLNFNSNFNNNGTITINAASASVAQIATGISGSGTVDINQNILATGTLTISTPRVAGYSGQTHNSNIIAGAIITITNISSSAAVNASANITNGNITYTNAAASAIHTSNGSISSCQGAITVNAIGSAVGIANGIFIGGPTITNNAFTGSAGAGVTSANRNIFQGQGHTLTVTGSTETSTGPNFSDNAILGRNVTIFSNQTGAGNYRDLNGCVIGGQNLIVTASNSFALTEGGGAHFGRYNVNDGIRNKTGETVFSVGTGTATTRKTGFLIDSGSNTFVEGSFNVSGSTTFTGSISIASTFQAKFATGSNQQAGTAVLDGANPGTVTVSNSLVTANSIIMLTKQTLTNAHMVAVSSKGAGTFTITSNGNGDTDTVGWFIINNS